MPLQLWWLQTTLSFATLSLPALGTAALAHHTRTVWPLTGVGVVYFLLSVPVGAFTVTGSAILWLVAAGMFATRTTTGQPDSWRSDWRAASRWQS